MTRYDRGMGKMAQAEGCQPVTGVTQCRAVLVVDNDANVRSLIETLLLRAGYPVLTASDAASALACMRRQPVDLVIMELAFPDMDGLALLTRIKCDPATRALPVLIVSVYNEAQLKARCAALGTCGFLSKPFHGSELVAAVVTVAGGSS
jgi:CheY-like chemotaxis protein